MFNFSLLDVTISDWPVVDVGSVFVSSKKKGVLFRGSALYVERTSGGVWDFDFLYLDQFKDKAIKLIRRIQRK